MSGNFAQTIFDAVPAARYVAIYRAGQLEMAERASLANASAPESDKYEELLVNPTLLKLLAQRGDIDCGGLEYVLVRYGNFFQFIHPLADGHLSVAIEPDADVPAAVELLRSLIRRAG